MRGGPKAATATALAFVLMACGGAGVGHAQSTAPSPSGDPDARSGGKAFATAAAETAKFGADARPGVFPRTVTHALGETRLARKPTRIVVLDGGELDGVLALGLTPVGMAVLTPGQTGVPPYLAGKARRKIALVGATDDLDLQKIADLKPDLILGSRLRDRDLYGRLSAIAPTVMSIRPGFPWKEDFRLVGAAVGEETKAAKVLGDYERAVATARATIKGSATVSLLRFMPGRTRLYANLSFAGAVLKDVGLPRPRLQDVDALAVNISPETVAKADGDWLLYASFGAPDASGETAVLQGDQWKALPAVKAGKAVRVPDELWFLGVGPTGAMAIVADLQRILGPRAEARADPAKR